ncbi:pilus assembly protein [Aquicoccus sp. SU-CL01552]|uniref:pilus assembly protein n=1 Tax=Aquicoccus sp. SU-CL01552 TaxID=3127656 RepID=UPI00310A3586
MHNLVRNMVRSFARDEEGAVTVDWVMLVAVVVVSGGLAVAPMLLSVDDLGAKIAAAILALDFGW